MRTGSTPELSEIYARFGPPDREILASFLPPAIAGEAFRDLLRAYASRLSEIPLFPGVTELLDGLHEAGIPLALTTGRGGESTRLLLASTGLAERFEAVVPGDGLPPKPAPDGIRKTLGLLGVGPGAALFIGDTTKDVEAARAAGVRSAAALWGTIEREEVRAAGADYELETPGAALSAITGT